MRVLRCRTNAHSFSIRRCGNPAKLQCPDCKKLGCTTDSSFYCSQECFKESWKEHKKTHPEQWLYVTKRGAGRQDKCPSFPWTGDLRPFPVSPTLPVPKDIPKPDWARHPKGWPMKEMESKQQQIIVQRTQVWPGRRAGTPCLALPTTPPICRRTSRG